MEEVETPVAGTQAAPAVGFPRARRGRRPPAYPHIALRRDALRRRSLALADVLSLTTAYGIIWLVYPPDATLRSKLVLIAALPLWVVLNKLLGLYDRDPVVVHKSTLDELPRMLLSVLLGANLVYLVGPLLPGLDVAREQTVAFCALAMVLMPASRAVVRAVVRRQVSRERCVIVGSGAVADKVARKVSGHAEYGIELAGYVDEVWGDPGGSAAELPRLGDISEFDALCYREGVERVIIAFSSLSDNELLEVMRTCKRLNIKISVVPRLFEAIGHAVEMDDVEGLTLLGLRGFTRTRSSLMLKRTIDVVAAAAGLFLLAPLLLAIAVAIKLSSRGPVFFSHERIGRGHKPFRLYKFRSMYHGADRLKARLAHLNEASEPMFKIARDPRLTRVGRFIRRYSLDELPQLWNVLKGEMSLVGPRPLVFEEDDHVIGRHRDRLDLTPGLTGPWQVLGRTSIPFAEMVTLDYLYVAEWSLWSDIKLLLRTAVVVLRGDGH
jgi:exopolysaccharide biosynthesis polyprenyl glycosylphosphotransferase